MARLGRIIGAIGGAILGGPAGAVAGYMAGNSADEAKRGKAELKKQEGAQNKEYENQRSRIREESDRIGKQLESSRNKLQAGVARASRSRIRGGIFGEQSTSPALGSRLG
jgi:hypothetical protein